MQPEQQAPRGEIIAIRVENSPQNSGGALKSVVDVVKRVSATVILAMVGAVAYDVQGSTDRNPGVIQTAMNFKEGLISGEVERIIEEEAKAQSVDVNLVKAVAWAESSLNPHASSSQNSHGLMQLNARYFHLKNPYDPRENIHEGVKELARLLRKYQLEIALAAYNAGEGSVEKAGGKIPDFKETQEYVSRVLGRKALLDALIR